MADSPTGLQRSSPRRRLPRVLHHEPEFRLLFSSQLLSVLGDRVTSIAMPFAVIAAGGGVGQVALVSAAQFLPFLALALPAGVWADTWNRKRMLIAADLVRLLTQALAAILLFTGTARVEHLIVLAALFGSAEALFAPAFSGLLPATVSIENLQAAQALRAVAFSASNIAGPALAGVMIAYGGGPGSALLLDAASFAVSAVLLTRLRPSALRRLSAEPAGPPAFLHSLRDGWSQVRSRSWVGAFLAGFAAYHIAVLPAIFVVGPVLMQNHYDGARSWALVTALFGVGNVLGDVLLLRWRPRHALRIAAVVLIGASSQAFIIGSGLPVVAIGLLELLAGACVTTMFTLWETTLGEHIPSSALSRVSSYDYLATTGSIPLGNLVAGLAAARLGTQPALTVMSLVGMTAALGVTAMPSVRKLTRAPATG